MDSYQNKKYLECNTWIVFMLRLAITFPKSNYSLLAWYHLCCVWASTFTDKFRRSTNRFFQVPLCFVMLILIVDSCFVLFMRLCFSAQGFAHLVGEILLDVGSTEIAMFTNIVPITLQLALIVFFPIGNPFIIKDCG